MCEFYTQTSQTILKTHTHKVYNILKFKRDTWEFSLPKLNNFPKKRGLYKHITTLNSVQTSFSLHRVCSTPVVFQEQANSFLVATIQLLITVNMLSYTFICSVHFYLKGIHCTNDNRANQSVALFATQQEMSVRFGLFFTQKAVIFIVAMALCAWNRLFWLQIISKSWFVNSL